MNVNAYLNGHNVTEIKVGQSGANVYEIDGRYVLKHVVRQKLKEELFAAYTREVLFYRNQMIRQRIYLPKVLQAETSENEIQYLHGSSEERVEDIYSKMTKDFKGSNL